VKPDLDRGSYSLLVIGSALIGASLVVVLAVAGIASPVIDGATGFALWLWIGAWGTLRNKKAGNQKSCP